MTEPASLHDAEQTLEATRAKRYAAYPAYRPSSIDWLGDVPEHWPLIPLKHRTQFLNGMAFKPDEWSSEGVPIIRIVNLNGGEDFNCFEGRVNERYHVEQGDLLFGWSGNRGTSFGPFLWWRSGLHYLNQHIFKLDDYKDNKHWFYWALKAVTGYIEEEAHGIIGMVHVTKGRLGAVKIPVPPAEEQQAIARFLDEQTKKIDDLIEAKRDLLRFVEEKKQSVISHAVIKGLRSDVSLKESPHHWLGDIPDHWKYMPIKWVVETPVTDGPHETPEWVDEGVPFVSAEGVFDGRVHLDRCRSMITPDQHREYSKKACPKRDDIFIVKSGATTGKVGYVDFDDEFNIWSPLALIRCDTRLVLPRYAYYAFIETSFLRQVQLFWSYGTQPNIGMGDLQNLVIAVPPLDEQDQIIAHLESEVGKLDALANEASTAIESLGELRTGVISAAVTGKIDVRGGAA